MHVFLDGCFVSQRNRCYLAILFFFQDYFFFKQFFVVSCWKQNSSSEIFCFLWKVKTLCKEEKNPLWPVLLRICLAAGQLCFYPLLLHHPCCAAFLLFSFLFVNRCPSPKQHVSCTLSKGFTTDISLFWQAEMISKWIVNATNVRPAVSDEGEEAVTPLSRARFPAGSSCWHRIAMCPFERLSRGPWDFLVACWDHM